MPASPDATNISVREVLAKFDGDFAAVARAVENGEFALWVGSGISRSAANLGDLIDRAMEFLRSRSIDPATEEQYMPALQAALRLARVKAEDAAPLLAQPFETWPIRKAVRDEIWNSYSRLLDIRIKGEPADYMLWDAVDVRAAFAHAPPPASQHLCIAILMLEGAVREVASANWDGFIEAAVTRLTSGQAGVLQVVVDPEQLRSAPGRARLLKFHGCVIHATNEPGVYRKYLTGSHTQIAEWPNNPIFSSIRGIVTELATNRKSLVLGLSIQDANLQGVFSAAKQVHPWPWPCAPQAPGHVFCEDEIKDGQRDVLKIVYGDAYNAHIDEIEAGAHLRAWAEQVLVALTLKVLADKLIVLLGLSLHAAGKEVLGAELASRLVALRDAVADLAIVDPTTRDRTAAVNRGMAIWSRLLAMFRSGAPPANLDAYEVLSASTPEQLVGDQNAQAAGLGSLGIALSLLQEGRARGLWAIELPAGDAIAAGALVAAAGWTGANRRPLFLVRSAGEAIALEKHGAFANDNAIVIHADSVWGQMQASAGGARRRSRAPGRTGTVETRHVSIEALIEVSTTVDELANRFVAEVTL
ncbi:SIR2 family protein [Phenylobacterium sp.]|uniref:SIR2 family protein n=1 Tax=Phenylobacterium sp. TaxID=1871053 RepID=UPI0035B043DC